MIGQSRTTPGIIRAALACQRVGPPVPPSQRGDHRGASPAPPHPVHPVHPCKYPPLSFPHPPPICIIDGDWQLQVPPGAPGTARQGPTRIIMLVNHGGTATQPRAPGHERPRTALRAARHGRLSAALRAPGADVPLATAAGAPGQYCLSADPRAPGHGRPLAITARAPVHDRLSAALPAPGADLLLASTAKAAGQHRPSAAPLATVSSPAGQHRLRQEVLPHNPANPRTLTSPHSHRDTAHTRATHPHHLNRRSRAHGHPRPPVTTGGPQGGQPRPRPCSTADTGFLRQHPSRAPPPAASSLRRKPQSTSPRNAEGP